MKTSISKLLVSIVCVAMTMGVLPTVVFAETNTAYSVWVDGIQVTEENKNDVLGTADGDSATVTYNPATNTLTLNNMSISGDGTGKGIVLPTDKDSNIVVLGTNTISNYQQGFTSGWESAYEVSLTLSGEGSLSVKDCNIMTDGSIHKSIYVDGITLIGDNTNGIVCDDDFIVKNGAVVDLKIPGGNSNLWNPVYVNGSIEIYDSTVTIDGGATYGLSSVGYNKANNHMKIVNSNVTLKGEGWGTYVGNNTTSAATLYVKDSTINVQSLAGIYVTGDAVLEGNVKLLTESNRQLVRTASGGITVDLGDNADIQGFINAKNTDISFVTDYTLTTDWTVTEGRTLTVPEGVTLTLAEGVKITRENNTGIVNNGTILIPCKANNVITVDTGNIPEVKHVGGQATCTAKAVCEVCGEAYGEQLAHAYTEEIVNADYLKSSADCTNAALYYKSCSCGAKGEETFESGTANGHSHTVLQYNEMQHWYKCANCDDITTKVNHSGGAADCTNKAVCSTCNQVYGSALGHSYTITWNKDATNHWHECACGDKTDTAAHTPKVVNAKEATTAEKGYTGDTVCEVCGYEIAKGEDVPVKTTTPSNPDENKPTSPKTGDNSNMALWITLLMVFALGLAGVMFLGKKRKACK